MGVEETINELIPYLDTFIEGIYNDDEVLVVLTEQFGSFLPYVGGIENVHLILNLLEKLAMVEENMVRARAVKHLHNIALLLNNENVENLFVAMLVRLADTDCFVCKSSATELFGVSMLICLLGSFEIYKIFMNCEKADKNILLEGFFLYKLIFYIHTLNTIKYCNVF